MPEIGRNDSCPCGSGKKYKHCCLGGTPESGSGFNPASEIASELEEALSGLEFDSMEQMESFAQGLMEQRNRRPVDEFEGLSPEAMADLLYRPFDSPQWLRFAETLEVTPDAPVLILFGTLAGAIDERGLKLTAKGNLPRKVCQDAAAAYATYLDEDALPLELRYGKVTKENDFYDLNVTHHLARLAGMVRKYHGRLFLTRKGRKLLADRGPAGAYPELARTFATKFNWAYGDRYPDLAIVQQSFAFTLYLLSRYGDVERPAAFYEDAFLRAFPMALYEAKPGYLSSPEEQLRRCYTLRSMERFASFFGLITLRPDAEGIFLRDHLVRKTPLLNQVVRFHVPS